jgi:hypothetical protein
MPRSPRNIFSPRTLGVPMRNRRSSLLLFIPLVAALATGCSDSGPPSNPEVKTDQKAVDAPPPPKVTGKAVKKPKVIGKMVGPSRIGE